MKPVLRYAGINRGEIRATEQVAAVCFRRKRSGIEFLLVRTGNGRWTFPKGRSEPGLTRAQAAAIEAFEEAGVHGLIEEASFARYRYRKPRSGSSGEEITIHAFLCAVSNAERPQESKRKPKWFSTEKAKRKLRERRTEEDGVELTRVIELAVTRIQRGQANGNGALDALRRVKFDAFEIAGTAAILQPAAMRRYIRRDPATPAGRWVVSPETRSRRLLTGKVVSLNARKMSGG